MAMMATTTATAFMSDRDSYLRGRADWFSSYADEGEAAVTEARRILETAEPQTGEWWRKPAWDVAPLRIAGIPDSCQIKLADMPAWSALAESLASFTAADEPAAWLAERQS